MSAHLNLGSFQAAWQKLLPKEVAVSDGDITADYPELTLAEIHSLNAASKHRTQEFKAGRYHAKSALAQIGIHTEDLPKLASGAPAWPNSALGSITHTPTYVAAVAAKSSQLVCIGIDCEYQSNIAPHIWAQFLTPAEFNWLLALSADLRIQIVAQVWSIKEAALKALNLRDRLLIHTELVSTDEYDDVFEYAVTARAPDKPSTTLIGHAAQLEQWVFASVYL